MEDMTDTPLPGWMEAIAAELGLDDTPSPVLDEHVTSLLDVVKNIEFTASGWEHVKKLIRDDPSVTRTPLFQRITDGNDDDLLLFTIMVAIPYGLAKSLGRRLGYSSKNADNIINYFTAAFVIAMARGYDLGVADSREERPSGDE